MEAANQGGSDTRGTSPSAEEDQREVDRLALPPVVPQTSNIAHLNFFFKIPLAHWLRIHFLHRSSSPIILSQDLGLEVLFCHCRVLFRALDEQSVDERLDEGAASRGVQRRGLVFRRGGSSL